MMTVKGSIISTMVIRVIGIWALLHGFLIVAGGPDRWANPFFETAMKVPGSPYTWGAFLMLGGFLVLLGSYANINVKLFGSRFTKFRVKNVGLIIIALYNFMFAITTFFIVFNSERISYSSSLKDLLLTVICMILTKVVEPINVKKNN